MSWYYQTLIIGSGSARGISIWELVWRYHSSYCSDPRDRVFGLLSLADSISREAFRPDYKKSPVEVLLHLMQFKAKHEPQSNFRDVHNVVGAFALDPNEPEIARMLEQRRTATNRMDPCPKLSEMSRRRHHDPFEDDGRLGLVWNVPFDTGNSCRINLEVHSYCKVFTGNAGGYVVLLSKSRPSWRATRRHDWTKQSTADGAVSLHAFDGTVVGVANKQVQDEDTLLLFRSGTIYGVFDSGLIVRRCALLGDGLVAAKIVGQCLVDFDVEVSYEDSSCACTDHHFKVHYADDLDETWKVRMSAEDLLLFIAQDLKAEHRNPGKFEAPMVDAEVQHDESRKRLGTSVTRDEFSSYAVLTEPERRRRRFEPTRESGSPSSREIESEHEWEDISDDDLHEPRMSLESRP